MDKTKFWKDFDGEPFLINPQKDKRTVKNTVAKKKTRRKSRISLIMKKAQRLIKSGVSKSKALKTAWGKKNPRKIKTKLGRKHRPVVYRKGKSLVQSKYRVLNLGLGQVNRPKRRVKSIMAKKRKKYKIKRYKRNPVRSLALLNPKVNVNLANIVGITGGGLVSYVVASNIIPKVMPALWQGMGKPLSVAGIGLLGGSMIKGKWGNSIIIGSVTIASIMLLTKALNINLFNELSGEEYEEDLQAVIDDSSPGMGEVLDEYSQNNY